MKNNEYRHGVEWPYHISCGGIVYRKTGTNTEIILLSRSEADGDHYHLPKGTLIHNETIEACALREVEEESGAKGNIAEYLGAISHDYVSPKNKLGVSKTIHYFAIQLSEDSDSHDNEHDKKHWLSLSDARNLLFETEPRKEEYLIVDRLIKYFEINKSSV